jgi:hypothetical protein
MKIQVLKDVEKDAVGKHAAISVTEGTRCLMRFGETSHLGEDKRGGAGRFGLRSRW